ncbi:MAG: hypothetical protein HYY37_04430 [Candidatus Aenigmarchaeota archaeon]|nr:hypothetical protein [Candidatus Aenigmarchaeota archaeon]
MKIIFLIVGLALLCSVSLAQAVFSEPQKIVILSLAFKGGTLTAEKVDIAYGSPPDRLSPGELTFTMRPNSNRVLGTYGILDPRMVYDVGYIENVSFMVVLPYHRSTVWIDVAERNATIASFSIAESFAAFCSTPNNICDPDCAQDVDCPANAEQKPESKQQDYTLLAAALVLVLLVIAAWLGYRKLKEARILKEVRMRRRA